MNRKSKKSVEKPNLELSEYTPEYCSFLEMSYGKDMLSEGKEKGIEWMFKGIDLYGKHALDIGSGLGGVAFYLADKHLMKVTGIEVNRWMIDEAHRRIPPHLKNCVNFILNIDNAQFPFDSAMFDIIYSKNVLTHVKDKKTLFSECHRVMKSNGKFIVTDWLCAHQIWGSHMVTLIELENLSLYPMSKESYVDLSNDVGFKVISKRDDSILYKEFNLFILESLKASFSSSMIDKKMIESAIQAHDLIVKAIEAGELKVMNFCFQKK